MNQVNLCGRLTRDAEVRYTQGEKPMAVARFTLAVDRRFKKDGQPTADFIQCIAFGKTAEIVEKYTKKGVKIIVMGEWRTGSYTNKNGDKVFTNDCNVNNIEFCESKSGNNSTDNSLPPAPSGNDDFMSIPDGIEDGLPFN